MEDNAIAKELVSGMEVGPWRLTEKLGQGSYGAVWGAEQVSGQVPGGPWALKLSTMFVQPKPGGRVPKKAKETPDSVRLHNEYQLTALRLRPKLLHDPDAWRCLAMPPLGPKATGKAAGYRFLALRNAGPDISAIVGKLGITRLPLGAACAVGVDVLSALATMHRKCCMMHLDVKPDNICVGRPPSCTPTGAVAARSKSAVPVDVTSSLIDLTTSMLIRPATGERPPVDVLGASAYTSFRHREGHVLVPAMDLDSLGLVLATLVGRVAPWFSAPPGEVEASRLAHGRAHFAMAESPKPRLAGDDRRAAASLAAWFRRLPAPLAAFHTAAAALPDDPLEESYADLRALLQPFADRDELLAVLESFEAAVAGEAEPHPDMLAELRAEGTAKASSSKGGRRRKAEPEEEEEDDDDADDDDDVESVQSVAARVRRSPRRSARPPSRASTPQPVAELILVSDGDESDASSVKSVASRVRGRRRPSAAPSTRPRRGRSPSPAKRKAPSPEKRGRSPSPARRASLSPAKRSRVEMAAAVAAASAADDVDDVDDDEVQVTAAGKLRAAPKRRRRRKIVPIVKHSTKPAAGRGRSKTPTSVASGRGESRSPSAGRKGGKRAGAKAGAAAKAGAKAKRGGKAAAGRGRSSSAASSRGGDASSPDSAAARGTATRARRSRR